MVHYYLEISYHATARETMKLDYMIWSKVSFIQTKALDCSQKVLMFNETSNEREQIIKIYWLHNTKKAANSGAAFLMLWGGFSIHDKGGTK